MRGRLRNKNRQQSQKEQTFQQGRFDAGWINDLPASDLPKGGMALLENFVGFPEYLEGRSGSQKYSNTALPGAGSNLTAACFHPGIQKWLIVYSQSLYISDYAMTAWTEVKSLAFFGAFQPTEAGDASNQMSNWSIRGANTSNTAAYILYWSLTNSGSTRTVSIYKNSGMTQLVAQGSRVGDGVVYLQMQNSSGLIVSVTVAYTGNDTDSGNTLTVDSFFQAQKLGVIGNPKIIPYKSDFLVFTAVSVNYVAGSANVYGSTAYVDATNNVFYDVGSTIQCGYPNAAITGSGSQAAATPYGRRYLATFSRILDDTGVADYTKNRTTGNTVFEGPSNGNGYGEHWIASAVSVSTPNTVAFNGIQSQASPHYTHISLYATMDIGVNGIDPVTGSGNNREIYIWVADIEISQATFSDTVTDDVLRARLGSGFSLKSRFWKELPLGEVGEVNNNFVYKGLRGGNYVAYAQNADPRFIGFYNSAFQFFKLDDSLQVIAKSPDMMSFMCSNKTYISNPNAYFDAGGNAIAPTYVLQHLTVASENIGVTDWGSFTPMDNAFVAHCSDHTIRVWNSSYWSDDIASRRINQIVRTMIVGSVGIYGSGAYYLFYSTVSTGSTVSCLRYGFSRDSGFGWGKVTGSAWPVLVNNTGAVQFSDGNKSQRMLVFDYNDAYAYCIETFGGPTITKVFKDKVAVAGTGGTDITCTARFPEWTAAEESCDLFHKESYIYDRPYSEATGYPAGFSRTLKAYTDGSTAAASTITGAPAKGDLQFFDKVTGNRIQMEVVFATSGARLTGLGTLCDVFDRQAIGATAANTTDATSQAALASNLKHWLTRPINLLNRANGSNYTLTGTAPTNVTGPDGKSYGLSFISGASYSQSDFTVYSDFAVHFWVKSGVTSTDVVTISGSRTVNIRFTSTTNIRVIINSNTANVAVSSIGSGWHDFWVMRSGATLWIYQNGILVTSTSTDGNTIGGAAVSVNASGAAMILYDMRTYASVLTAADIAYYYADISSSTLAGNKVLPLA